MRDQAASAATVVMVHGSMHGAWCWDRTARRLAAGGVPHLAVELPGHGRREPEWRAASMDAYAGCVSQAVKAIDGPIVLVGHSMAGQIVARVAATHPERIARLVLLNAQVLTDGQTHLSTLPLSVQERYLALALEGAGRIHLEAGEIYRRWLQDLPPDDEHVRRAITAMTPQPLRPLLDPAVSQDFGAAGVEAVYLRSTEDVGSPPARTEGFVRRLPRGTAVIAVPGGHDCMISRPDVVAMHLTNVARGEGSRSQDSRGREREAGSR